MISQQDFLEGMGIQQRCQQLKAASPKDSEKLEGELQRLTQPEEMGEIYKCMFITLRKNGEIFPFSDPEQQHTYS